MKLNNLILKVLGVFAVVGFAFGTISCDKGGEEAAPPAEGGEEAAPAEGGEEAAPAEGGDAAPAEGGEG